MASYTLARAETDPIEGGYVNDRDDPGGETWRGIARRFHPSFVGWDRIDAAKDRPDFPACLERDEVLRVQVDAFYREHFWDPIGGDHIRSQALANELYDSGVNLDPRVAVRWLQRCLNVNNREQRLYPDLEVDGRIGHKTLDALAAFEKTDSIGLLLDQLNALQGAHYIEVAEKNPRKEKYIRGWYKRVKIRAAGRVRAA